jgi:hypothetical protein
MMAECGENKSGADKAEYPPGRAIIITSEAGRYYADKLKETR